MNSKKHNASAFTLIELLVVVAIISVLAAMLLPSLTRARSKALQTSCMNNLKQLSLGIVIYGDDHDEYYPVLGDSSGPTGATPPAEMAWQIKQPLLLRNNTYPWNNWLQALYNYNGSTGTFKCPGADKHDGGWTYAWSSYDYAYVNSDRSVGQSFLSASHEVWKQGRERFRDNKIVIMDGPAGNQKVGGWRWRLDTYGSGVGTATPHNLQANTLMLTGEVLSLRHTFGGFHDGGQTWFSTAVVSTSFTH